MVTITCLLRRSAFTVAATALASIASAATAPMSITSVSIGAAIPYNSKATTHPMGTMSFRQNGTNKSLPAYYNLTAPFARQCVELTRRYAAVLGFAGFAGKIGANDDGSKLPSLGDGKYAAQNFAGVSGGTFIFVANDSTVLPKPGAVLSTPLTTVGAGHVMIVGSYPNPGTASAVTIPVFEQNTSLTYFRTVAFAKQKNGRWRGTYYNMGVNNIVVGWANPKD
jgi:hypothetical protein